MCRFWMPQRSKIPTEVSTPAICCCHVSFNIQNSLNYNGILSVIFLRYIYKGELKRVHFYRCPRPSLYSNWSQLINRKDFKITKDTKVCSNHFKAGKPTKEDPIPSLYLKGYSLNQTDNKRRPPRIRDEIPRKTRKMEALNCSTSVERNEMHNHIGNENVEPQIDFCNENFSESLLPLHSKTDSETNNVQIQSESVTACGRMHPRLHKQGEKCRPSSGPLLPKYK